MITRSHSRAAAEPQAHRAAWLPALDLACACAAGILWVALPRLGAWLLPVAFLPWALRLAFERCLSRRTPFEVPMLLFVLTAAVGVWAAYDRSTAWARFWPIIGGVVLFYALANAASARRLRLWLLAGLGAGLAVCFLASHDWGADPAKIGALTKWGLAVQSLLPVLPGTGWNSNEVGGLLAMLLPFAGLAFVEAYRDMRLCLAETGQRRPVHWLAVALALALLAIVAFGLLLTTSRGAWLGLASALLLAGWWAVAGWLTRTHPQRRTPVFLGPPVVLVIAILVTIIFWPEQLLTAPSALPGPATWLPRLEFQRNSLTLVRDYPIIGAGLGTFPMIYSTYVLLIHVGFILHSHSLYLNVAVSQGLPGLLALVWMWGLFAWIVSKNRLRSQVGVLTPGLGAAALALIVALVHGLADTALYSRVGVLFLFVPLAFAVSSVKQQAQRIGRRLVPVLSVGAGLVLIPIVIWHTPLLSTIYSNLGAVYESQAELSVYHWPEWPLQDAVRRAVDLSRPVAAFERALTLDPGNATANRRLGMIELSLGEYDAALGHLQAAYVSEPSSITTRQLLGEALIVNERRDEGQAMWEGLSNEQSQLGGRVFWYQYIGEEQRAGWLRQAIGSR